MPARPPDSRLAALEDPSTLMTELDALTTPFNRVVEVDLLLSDLQAPAAPATSAPMPLSQLPVAGRRGGGGRPVLVVDSTAIARKFLALRLQKLGYEVHVAEDGEQALGLVEQQTFAIVFTEVTFGAQSGLDGLALCQAIKQKPDHLRGIAPAVVFVTGQTGSADRVRSSLAGCDAYLTKPLLAPELSAALDEIDPLFK